MLRWLSGQKSVEQVLQLWRESYLDLPVSMTIPTAVKGGILDTYSYEKKGILAISDSGM